MERGPASINFVSRGWIEVGGMRMCLVEIRGGFYELREVLSREVGETEDDLVYHAGICGSASFITSAMDSGQITPDEYGFRTAVDMFSEAGFGNFEIVELSWPDGWAIVRAPDSSEGWAYAQNQNIQDRPRCDYSRGVLAAFMSETHRRASTAIKEIFAVESKCIGRGNAECEFLVGPPANLKARGYDVEPPKTSVREKLERSIGLLRDSNKRLMKAEMQYRSLFDVTLDAIVIIDRDLNVLNCNRSAERLLGADRGTMVGNKLPEYLPEVRDISPEEKVEEALRLNKSVDFEVSASLPGGKAQPFQVRLSPIHGDLAVVFHAMGPSQ